MLIKPTIDRKFAPGECSTVSDYKDNVHWFQALTRAGVYLQSARAGREARHHAAHGPRLRRPAGRSRVRRPDPHRLIGYKEANQLYG